MRRIYNCTYKELFHVMYSMAFDIVLLFHEPTLGCYDCERAVDRRVLVIIEKMEEDMIEYWSTAAFSSPTFS